MDVIAALVNYLQYVPVKSLRDLFTQWGEENGVTQDQVASGANYTWGLNPDKEVSMLEKALEYAGKRYPWPVGNASRLRAKIFGSREDSIDPQGNFFTPAGDDD